ncbi:hypothetical protein G9P44_001106 [Scheffersomyces stipitis]|nr:hypothetical protein G9P44_001106 [Scheffersomyces stipitis]
MLQAKSGVRIATRNVASFSKRFQSTSSGIWTDFSKRSASLKLNSPEVKQGLLHKINPEEGPASISDYNRRLAYHSPEDIDETFKQAYELLQQEAEVKYKEIEGYKKRLGEAKSTKEVEFLKKSIDKLLVDAEVKNPEVLYNVEYTDVELLDKSQPVYRHLLKEKWEAYDLMITMQRLEQLHMIPDTLPTLDPKVDVKVKFPHNVKEEFADWVVPGTVLPAFAVSQPPTIQIQEFETVEEKNLYSIVLVNPDTPDLKTNSYSTTLQYGLANVPLDNVDNVIDTSKLFSQGEKFTFKDYQPLVPEKNAQTQRACLWVFRQFEELTLGDIARENFDIRDFASKNNLTAVGAHIWRQRFDRSVNYVRNKYGLGEGRVFRRVRGTAPVV